MKILNAEDFLKLPSGTVYATGSGLAIKGQTIGEDDSFETYIHNEAECPNNECAEPGDEFDLVLEGGTRGRIPSLDEEDKVFAVFDDKDTASLINILLNSMDYDVISSFLKRGIFDNESW